MNERTIGIGYDERASRRRQWCRRVALFLVVHLALVAASYGWEAPEEDEPAALHGAVPAQPVVFASEFESLDVEHVEPPRLVRPWDGNRNGTLLAKRLVLRTGPSREAPVLGVFYLDRLKEPWCSILDAMFDHLLVQFTVKDKTVLGWARWGDVQPSNSAVVLDTRTGRTVGRVPLGWSMDSVAFSPDGSRAAFFESTYVPFNDYTEKGDWRVLEFRTSDLTPMRAVAPLRVENGECTLAGAYYAKDGTLRVLLGLDVKTAHTAEEAEKTRHVKKELYAAAVDGTGRILDPKLVASGADHVTIAPDARSALLVYDDPGIGYPKSASVQVLDLATFSETHSFRVDGTIADLFRDLPILSRDGSKVYGLEEDRTVVVSATTGSIVWRKPYGRGYGRGAYVYRTMDRDSAASGTLLLRETSDETDEGVAREPLLTDVLKKSAVDRRIGHIAEASGVRMAVDGEGEQIFRLDPSNRIVQTYRIDRPDLTRSKHLIEPPYYVSSGMRMSPDGRYVVVFITRIVCCC